jgi:hypothetical protein
MRLADIYWQDEILVVALPLTAIALWAVAAFLICRKPRRHLHVVRKTGGRM